MGSPTPPPPVVDGSCPKCDGILWPVGDSPRFISVEFEDLVKCPAAAVDPPNGIFVLEADEAIACRWRYDGLVFDILMQFPALTSEIYVEGNGVAAGFIYFWQIGALCQSDFTNSFVACGGGIGSIDGTAKCTWS